ncbi:hypothetical protein MS3_00001933 [Schistosoma haematobium]|uniref:Uncharacterized protein n=2 Tax=Schistosoma haematobium TaxID=6185 RepID=A0A6A5DHL7_SCHHA|nr:hypothetical protein MS3_00001933 [Schistosoma haematobium]KAH9596146.1 hypothetical protein MS3_00001933 [Schistosoma haematobium]
MNALMDNTSYRNEANNCGIVSATSTSEDDQLSLCCLCGQTFPSIKSLHMHINVVHEEVADSFDFQLTDGENDDSHSVTLGSRISLSSSSEEFISKPETPVVCPNCKKSFPGLTSLRVHIDSVHHGNRIPQCDYCMKKFSTLSYLRMHISTVHEGVRAYSCNICEKSYTQKHSLKKHLRNSHSISSSQDILDDSGPTNGVPNKSSQSACSNEMRTFKSRKRLLVDSPIIPNSCSPIPSRSNEVNGPVSLETKNRQIS